MKKPKSISLSKMLLLVGALFAVNVALAIADDVTRIICVDFENDTLGTYYPDVQDKAIPDSISFYLYVENDPTNAVNETTGQMNKVLHVENTSAGESNYVLPVFDITLPTGLTVGDMDSIVFDMYCLSDNSSYNNIRYYVFPGDDDSWMYWGWGDYECDPLVSTIDVIGGQENKEKWVTCSIAMSPSFTANSNYETMKTWNHFKFSFGEENYAAHYYLDNIGFTYKGGSGTIVITSAGYATFYTESEYTMPEGVTGTTVTGVGSQTSDGGYSLTMPWEYASGTTVPAKTALVLKGDANTYTYAITSTDATAPTGNLLLGSTTETTTYGPEEGETYLFYELTNGSSGIGFYYGATDGAAFTSAANKAWLPLSESQARNAKFLGFGEGDTTGITSVENEAKTVKGIYTLQGVKVSDMTQPGIYIVDGRKVLVK